MTPTSFPPLLTAKRHRLNRAIALLLSLISATLVLITPIVGAQTSAGGERASAPTAPILVDGRAIARVGSIEGFSAETRADLANSKLKRLLSNTPPDQSLRVSPYQQGDLTTLRVNNRHLLTVTPSDVLPGTTAAEQAEEWSELLRRALDRAQYERTAAYRRRAWLISIGLIGLAIALHLAVRGLRRQLNRQIAHHGASASWVTHGSVKMVLQPCLVCLQLGVWIAALIYFTGLFPQSRLWRFQALSFFRYTLTNPIFELGETSYSLLALLNIVILALGLWLGVRAVTALVRSRLLRVIGADREMQDAIALLMQFLLTGIGFIIILQGLGVDVSSLAILASVLGVGIGFGLQNIANNFISGIIILFERPIRVGDFVKLGELTGTVERIGARSTEIRTPDYVTIIVPNSEFIQSQVVNWSHGYPVSRLHVPFGVAYGSGIRQVRAAVLEAVQVHPEVLRYPQPQIWFDGFGDSSLNFDLLVWIRDPRQQFRIRSDLYYLIEANLRRYQIEIPFPQRDLNLRSPQIEDLISLWAGRGRSQKTSMASLEQAITDHLAEPQPVQPTPPEQTADELLSELIECSILLRQKGELSDAELDKLMSDMRGPDGVEIKDRRYGLRVFPRCFVGNEAVTWLMQNQKATREEAIRIGQILIERGIIHHVTDEHTFEDRYLFYRFYEDECDKSPS